MSEDIRFVPDDFQPVNASQKAAYDRGYQLVQENWDHGISFPRQMSPGFMAGADRALWERNIQAGGGVERLPSPPPPVHQQPVTHYPANQGGSGGAEVLLGMALVAGVAYGAKCLWNWLNEDRDSASS